MWDVSYASELSWNELHPWYTKTPCSPSSNSFYHPQQQSTFESSLPHTGPGAAELPTQPTALSSTQPEGVGPDDPTLTNDPAGTSDPPSTFTKFWQADNYARKQTGSKRRWWSTKQQNASASVLVSQVEGSVLYDGSCCVPTSYWQGKDMPWWQCTDFKDTRPKWYDDQQAVQAAEALQDRTILPVDQSGSLQQAAIPDSVTPAEFSGAAFSGILSDTDTVIPAHDSPPPVDEQSTLSAQIATPARLGIGKCEARQSLSPTSFIDCEHWQSILSSGIVHSTSMCSKTTTVTLTDCILDELIERVCADIMLNAGCGGTVSIQSSVQKWQGHGANTDAEADDETESGQSIQGSPQLAVQLPPDRVKKGLSVAAQDEQPTQPKVMGVVMEPELAQWVQSMQGHTLQRFLEFAFDDIFDEVLKDCLGSESDQSFVSDLESEVLPQTTTRVVGVTPYATIGQEFSSNLAGCLWQIHNVDTPPGPCHLLALEEGQSMDSAESDELEAPYDFRANGSEAHLLQESDYDFETEFVQTCSVYKSVGKITTKSDLDHWSNTAGRDQHH